MPEQVSVSSDRVVEIVCRTELGAALWRAAANEALVEVSKGRVEELTNQRGEAGDRA